MPFSLSIPRTEIIMGEVTVIADEGDRDLQERLD